MDRRMGLRRRTALPLAVLVVVLSWSWWVPSVARAAAAVTVTADVTELALVPGVPAAAHLVVANSGDAAILVSDISVTAPAGVTVPDPTGAVGTAIPAGGSIAVPLDVGSRSGFTAGSIGVVVTATDPTGLTVRGTAGIALEAVDPPSAPTISLTLPTGMSDGETRRVDMTLSNASGPDLTHVVVRVVGDDDLTLTLPCPARTAPCTPGPTTEVGDVSAGATVVVALSVHVQDQVHTGTHTVRVVVEAHPAFDPDAPVVSSEASASTDLAVFGVDVLSPFGVTTLFVLPGLLALVVAQLSGRFVYPKSTSSEGFPEWKDPRSLAYIVPISALSYFVVWLISGQDLRYAAGTLDVVGLFVLGAVVGALAWAALAITYWRRTDRKIFRTGDSPHAVLRKLALRERSTVLPTVRPVAPGTASLCVLGPDGDARSFVCGHVGYTFEDTITDDVQQDWRAAVTDDDVAVLAALSGRSWAPLRRIGRGHDRQVALRWLESGVESVPTPGDPGAPGRLLLPRLATARMSGGRSRGPTAGDTTQVAGEP